MTEKDIEEHEMLLPYQYLNHAIFVVRDIENDVESTHLLDFGNKYCNETIQLLSSQAFSVNKPIINYKPDSKLPGNWISMQRTTLVQHIRQQEKATPGATGEFTSLMNEIMVASKIISLQVNSAGIGEEYLRAYRKNKCSWRRSKKNWMSFQISPSLKSLASQELCVP